ncbi:unnamed protein product [Acanthoscelides obtectus]|uniref:Uncharacterized protein n=1 Tax=Acanthoscelides obtectus TaxID=200917 RepID=A0A9P0K2H0_ACAOB|nr:unnamed protein product [Acanthoscelides obtectus]CAK1669635.1 hypothetical protein AOBTE_LOCUS27116 [Acanthoscelides obtectus]
MHPKNGLEHLLKSSNDGKIVLLKKDGLDNSSRSKLVRVIIDHLMTVNDPSIKIPDLFRPVAEEIVRLFPGERIESYYIPYCKTDQGKKRPTRGKLYARYANCKRALVLAQVQPSQEDSSEYNVGIGPMNVMASDSEKECYKELQQPSDDFERIFQLWQHTRRLRTMNLKLASSPLIYVSALPCLTKSFGYRLLVDDFNEKYPHVKDISIHKAWQKMSVALIEFAKSKNIQTRDMQYASEFADKNLFSLRLLPWFFKPSTNRGKGMKKCYKLSRQEMTEKFLPIVSTTREMEARIKITIDNLKFFDLSIAPFMIALGEPSKVTNYFVVLNNDIKYQFGDCLSALEVTLKIMHALDLSPPPEIKDIWEAIDHLVYKVSSSMRPGTSVFLSEFCPKLRNC